MTGGFDGLRALVTGGASGIGLATARQLAEQGCTVGVLDLASTGPDGCHYARADVSDDAQVRAGVAQLVDAMGGLDILVNCAGIGAQGTVEENDDDEWRHVLDVDVIGVARVSRAALPALRDSAHAVIVNITSVVAEMGLPRRAVYSAAKGALQALTRAMAVDLLASGVRVNAVSPGTADTPWVGRLLAVADDPEAERSALERRQPHRRLVTADEIAAAVCYLASPGAGSTNGTTLTVDGGLTSMQRPTTP